MFGAGILHSCIISLVSDCDANHCLSTLMHPFNIRYPSFSHCITSSTHMTLLAYNCVMDKLSNPLRPLDHFFVISNACQGSLESTSKGRF